MTTTKIPKVKVALGADFLKAFSELPHNQQKRVREFVDKFIQEPTSPGINYETIHSAADSSMRSVRISQEYRGIVLKPSSGDVYMLLWVDKHDEAYAWASKRRCVIHPHTGSIQVLLTEEQEVEPQAKPAKVTQGVATSSKGIFDAFTDEDLISLGVPQQSVLQVRGINDDNEVENLEKTLPREAFEAIFLLAAGYSVSETKEQLGLHLTDSVDTQDFAAAVERPVSKRNFVVVSDSAEMELILSAPLEQWRVFIHPSQRRLVEMQANGPIRVLGSAGTGKTVVAMHRAVWLAQHACGPGQKILFTTFSRNLAADIEANLKKICSRDIWEKIEIINLDAWTRRFLDKHGYSIRMVYETKQAPELWKQALSTAILDPLFDEEFMRSEWDNVIQAHGIENLSVYHSTTRTGRPQRLSREQRTHIWPAFDEYRALLKEKGLSEPADAYRAAARIIQDGKQTLPYRSIIVDEAQDFGNEGFRLVRAMVPAASNDLFIVGDSHQRIYGHQVVLSRSGIEIRGRSKKLRINYRTPEEIKNWASGLLQGLSFDDLDAGIDDMSGVRSIVHGLPPMVETASGESDQAEKITLHVKNLVESESAIPENICVVAESKLALEFLTPYLKQACPKIHVIETAKAEDSASPGLRLATIARVKGLEFDHVVIAGKMPGPTTEENLRPFPLKKRILMYVAATRARVSLYVCNLAKK